MTEGQLVSLAVAGWAVAVISFTLWLSERRVRIFIHNYTTFGGTPMKRARLHEPQDAEDRLEETLDRIEGIAGTKDMRRAAPEDAKFSEETLQNGIDWLLAQAQESGQALSVEQATEEALRMLNAEGTEM